MRLRAGKNVAKHLLAENGWESNIVADSSKVECLEGHQGRIQLQPLEGLPILSDDLYTSTAFSKGWSRVGSKALALHIRRRRLRKINSVAHFQPCPRNHRRRLQLEHRAVVHPFQQTAPRTVESSTLPWLQKPKQTEEQKKKTVAVLVPRKRAFWLFCCKGWHCEGRDGKTATGSSNAGKNVRAQGQAHLPNRFHPRFFGHARPKSACRAFAQIEKFCFSGLCVPKSARYYFGQHSERWWARLHLDADRKRVYDKGQAVQQNSLTVRSGRGPGPILRSSHGLRLFYRQTPSQKRGCSGYSGRINTKHLRGGVSRGRWVFFCDTAAEKAMAEPWMGLEPLFPSRR